MYDRGYGRGKRAWKPDLKDDYRAQRMDFARKYLYFDWLNCAVSTDEAKVRRAEYDNRAIWRAPGEETNSELIRRTNQEDDKTMCIVSGHVAYGENGKGTLIFLWDETEEERVKAEARVLAENDGNTGLYALAFASGER